MTLTYLACWSPWHHLGQVRKVRVFRSRVYRSKFKVNVNFGTSAQLCRAVSSQLRHVSTIGKKLVKHRYLLHMSYNNNGELRPTNGWDLLASLGAPLQILTGFASWQRYCTALSGRQPNFAALNRGRHMYSAGRPSRWALAHIIVMVALCNKADHYMFTLWFLLYSFFLA